MGGKTRRIFGTEVLAGSQRGYDFSPDPGGFSPHTNRFVFNFILVIFINLNSHFVSKGLTDQVDDVGAVAASALIPIASKLVDLVPDSVPVVVSQLWDLLQDQDELAAACNSFMGLLASILSLPQTPQLQQLVAVQPLSGVVPRLWPFLTHSTSSVRKATLQTLSTLTRVPADGKCLMWSAQLLQDAMRHVYQRVLVEPQSDVRMVAEQVRQLETCNTMGGIVFYFIL